MLLLLEAAKMYLYNYKLVTQEVILKSNNDNISSVLK